MQHRTHRARGFSMTELLVTLAILGMSAVLVGSRLASAGQTAPRTTAHHVKSVLQKARLLSIYKGVHHFVVLDPEARSVRVFEDSSSPIGGFDAGDTLISTNRWPQSVVLALPASPSPLPDPIGAGTLSTAWAMPVPDVSWGINVLGVMITPTGRILSGQATPQLIGHGAFVFTDLPARKIVVGLSVEGRSGSVRAFRHHDGSWSQL